MKKNKKYIIITIILILALLVLYYIINDNKIIITGDTSDSGLIINQESIVNDIGVAIEESSGSAIQIIKGGGEK